MQMSLKQSTQMKTRDCVSAVMKEVPHTSVLFTGTVNLLFSTMYISVTAGLIYTKFIYFMPSYRQSYIIYHI